MSEILSKEQYKNLQQMNLLINEIIINDYKSKKNRYSDRFKMLESSEDSVMKQKESPHLLTCIGAMNSLPESLEVSPVKQIEQDMYVINPHSESFQQVDKMRQEETSKDKDIGVINDPGPTIGGDSIGFLKTKNCDSQVLQNDKYTQSSINSTRHNEKGGKNLNSFQTIVQVTKTNNISQPSPIDVLSIRNNPDEPIQLNIETGKLPEDNM